MNWITLNSLNQIEEIKELSHQNPILIFKHSTRCGISRAVLRKFEQKYSSVESKLNCYYLDLLKYRSISNHISSVFNVYHQSPQVLIIKNGEQIAHHSHYDIISELNLITLI